MDCWTKRFASFNDRPNYSANFRTILYFRTHDYENWYSLPSKGIFFHFFASLRTRRLPFQPLKFHSKTLRIAVQPLAPWKTFFHGCRTRGSAIYAMHIAQRAWRRRERKVDKEHFETYLSYNSGKCLAYKDKYNGRRDEVATRSRASGGDG